jgi:oxidase EvaA
MNDNGVHTENEIIEWFTDRLNAYQYSIEKISLDSLSNWTCDIKTNNVSHVSGKFFSINGLHVEKNKTNEVESWSQPIIVQPEIGILGFIAKKLNGVLHLLVQAKMEPGNINFVQISPTVQATKSNYTQVHGGKRPPFIDFFIKEGCGKILLDQLQSEQGARYYKKRNRNVIVQVDESLSIEEGADFRWVTLGQLKKLHRFDNLVHLDCRSIIGSICFNTRNINLIKSNNLFGFEVLKSLICSDEDSVNSLTEVIGWITRIKLENELYVKLINIINVDNWYYSNGLIQHKEKKYFSLIGVNVIAASREVTSWSQPLIQNSNGGILGIIVQKKMNTLYFLIQARVEPGLIDTLELAPTVQYSPLNYDDCLPPFSSYFENIDKEQIRMDTFLSDEGGRFYKSQQRHIIIEISENKQLDIPNNYCWLTFSQLNSLARFSIVLNIELRSMLSCISFI